MNWQEYQDAVACLYDQAEEIGEVQRNVFVADRVTGQRRQIDVLLTIKTRGHALRVVIDAKFHSRPIDVTVVEEVLSLAAAVGANKAIIVASNGWTEPAEKKAAFESCDLRMLSLADALDLIVPDKWEMCSACDRDCIVLDQDGMMQDEGGGYIWWLAGRCRECRSCFLWCQDCGVQYYIDRSSSITCDCGHAWFNTENGLHIRFHDVGHSYD